MGCLSIDLIIWIIEIIAMVMIIRIVVPWAEGFFGFPAIVVQIISIVLWAVIAIWGVMILWSLFSCFGAGHLSLMPHR